MPDPPVQGAPDQPKPIVYGKRANGQIIWANTEDELRAKDDAMTRTEQRATMTRPQTLSDWGRGELQKLKEGQDWDKVGAALGTGVAALVAPEITLPALALSIVALFLLI